MKYQTVCAEKEPAQTALWGHLLALPERAITEGMSLWDWDAINAEVKRRRGGVSDEAADDCLRKNRGESHE